MLSRGVRVQVEKPSVILNSYYKYKDFEEIYSSKHGAVIKCVHKDNNKTYILKYYNLDIELGKLIYIINEIKISTFVHHENIINTYSYFYESSKLFIVQEYAEKGDLINIKESYENRQIPYNIVKSNYIKPLLNAVEYLHDNNIIHCDIKPENILVTYDNVCKLCDFGLAIDTRIHPANKFGGTLEFMAPEVIRLDNDDNSNDYYNWNNNYNNDNCYDEAIDMWAIGCVAYELIYSSSPFISDTVDEIKNNILHSNVIFHSDTDISIDCMKFILNLLSKEPIIRMNIKEAQQSDFIMKDQSNSSNIDNDWNNLRDNIGANVNQIKLINKAHSKDSAINSKRGFTLPHKMNSVMSKSNIVPSRINSIGKYFSQLDIKKEKKFNLYIHT